MKVKEYYRKMDSKFLQPIKVLFKMELFLIPILIGTILLTLFLDREELSKAGIKVLLLWEKERKQHLFAILSTPMVLVDLLLVFLPTQL